jgi:group I intron endonuclease
MASSGTNIILYQIINLISGEFYIGVTKQGLRIRRLQHLQEARRGKLNFPIYRAIRKHGADAFVFVQLCECRTYDEALSKEVDLIAIMKPGYNATKGGQGLSYWTGKKRDAETNAKISRAKTGVPRAPAPSSALEVWKENMRRAARARRKKVRCVSDGRVFESCAAASMHYGLHRLSVAKVVGKANRAVRGMRFELVSNDQ